MFWHVVMLLCVSLLWFSICALWSDHVHPGSSFWLCVLALQEEECRWWSEWTQIASSSSSLLSYDKLASFLIWKVIFSSSSSLIAHRNSTVNSANWPHLLRTNDWLRLLLLPLSAQLADASGKKRDGENDDYFLKSVWSLRHCRPLLGFKQTV